MATMASSKRPQELTKMEERSKAAQGRLTQVACFALPDHNPTSVAMRRRVKVLAHLRAYANAPTKIMLRGEVDKP